MLLISFRIDACNESSHDNIFHHLFLRKVHNQPLKNGASGLTETTTKIHFTLKITKEPLAGRFEENNRFLQFLAVIQ